MQVSVEHFLLLTALVGVQLVDLGDALRVTAPGVRVARSWLGRQAFGAGTPTDHAALRATGADAAEMGIAHGVYVTELE